MKTWKVASDHVRPRIAFPAPPRPCSPTGGQGEDYGFVPVRATGPLALGAFAITVAASAVLWSLVHGGPSVARGASSTSSVRAPRITAAAAATDFASKKWTR